MAEGVNISVTPSQPKLYYPYGVPANFDFLLLEGEKFLR
jgi:hypothetical protein